MPTEKKDLPKRKLREFLGETITVERIVTGTSSFGAYVLLITSTDSIISSGKVVLKQAVELAENLPATVKVTEKPSKNGFSYIMLE